MRDANITGSRREVEEDLECLRGTRSFRNAEADAHQVALTANSRIVPGLTARLARYNSPRSPCPHVLSSFPAKQLPDPALQLGALGFLWWLLELLLNTLLCGFPLVA